MTDVPTAPTVASTRRELRAACEALTSRDVAVVMTMGALHDGHARLIRAARERHTPRRRDDLPQPAPVRPQGGPLPLPAHLRLRHGDLHARRASTSSSRRPPTSSTPTATPACGSPPARSATSSRAQSRPGHFDGVLTVVGKLLHLTGARSAYFGQKDAQQLLLIRRMVRDLDFPVDVVSVPTVREPDGLAMSSRNSYLTDSDREVALCLSRALRAGAGAAAFGPVRDPPRGPRGPRGGAARPRGLPCARPSEHAAGRARVVPRARRCSRWRPGSGRPGSSTTPPCSSGRAAAPLEVFSDVASASAPA